MEEIRITIHSGHGQAAPGDALPRLAEHLRPRPGEAQFRSGEREILVRYELDAPVSMERDERQELARRAVLRIVEEICEETPGLLLDWYAVSPRG